jgi:TFIIF-interacting CTD phosphatase-like protein
MEKGSGAFLRIKRKDGTIPDELFIVQYRPHIAHFFATVTKHFDIAIFATGEQDYVDALLDVMDPSGQVFPKSRRYYRHHCTEVVSRPTPAMHVASDENTERTFLGKDLRAVGRPLNEVILVDHSATSGFFQPNNLLLIPAWMGDPFDMVLLQLTTNLMQYTPHSPTLNTSNTQAT